jgi:hypothetical protein
MLSGVLERATPHKPVEDDPADIAEDGVEAEGRAGDPKPARRPRTKRPVPGGETKGRKLNLPDGVYDRLQLLAIQRRSTASAIAAEILDRNLPRLRIERDA